MIPLHFKIYRYDPKVDQGPYFRHYTVEAEPGERILDCLNRIRWEQDGSLSYRMSCGHGVCGSDGMRINGTARLACQSLVKDYLSPEIVLEPLPVFKVVKDLMVDMNPFLDVIGRLRPYLIPRHPIPGKEFAQEPGERQKVEKVIRCILCACCTASCPVNWINPKYVGPAALVWAFRYIFDTRDEQRLERASQVDYPDGAWGCVNHFECTRVCPTRIPVMESINVIKREIEQNVRRTGNERDAATAKPEEGDLPEMSAQKKERIFSEEEIKEYSGQGGKPIYIAFQGKVYDVTESFMWTGGSHMAEHEAGKDLTDEIENAPHGDEVFERYPQVGVLGP